MARGRAKRALHLPVVALILAACVASAYTAVAPDPEAAEEWTNEPWRGNVFNLTKFLLPWHWPSRSPLDIN